MDLNFVKEHDPPDGQLLKELIVTEAVVGSVTLRDNKISLPLSVEYTRTKGMMLVLTVPVDLNFGKEHDPPDGQLLKELIVTEAVVGSITSLDNKISLPLSVEYTPKAGKTGQSLEKMFTKHVKTLQMCESCTED